MTQIDPAGRPLRLDDYPLHLHLALSESPPDAKVEELCDRTERGLRGLTSSLKWLTAISIERAFLHSVGPKRAQPYAIIDVLGNDPRTDLILGRLALFPLDSSSEGGIFVEEPQDGIFFGSLSVANTANQISWLVLRWLTAFRPEERDAEESSAHLQRSLEALVHTLQLAIFENQGLLDQIAEKDIVIDQLQSQIAALQAEGRRERVDARRSGTLVAGVRMILATISAVGGGFAGGVGSGLVAPEPQVQVIEAPTNADEIRDAIEACLHYERLAETEASPQVNG